MNDMKSSGRLRTITGDFQHLWNDLISFYRLPFGWKRTTWEYVAVGVIVFPGLFFLDPHIRMFFAEIHTPLLDEVFGFAHWYGKIHLTLDTFVILYVFGLVLQHEKLRIAGWKILQAFAISRIIVTVLKSIFGRWRPYTGHGSFAFVGFTFGPNAHLSLPSGDVGVAGDSPVARSGRWSERRGVADVGLFEEGQGTLPPQGGERALSLVPGAGPELQIAQVDLVDGEKLTWLHVGHTTESAWEGAPRTGGYARYRD
jgi:hypothetical protein